MSGLELLYKGRLHEGDARGARELPPYADFCYHDVYSWNPTVSPEVDFGSFNVAIGMFDGIHLGHQRLLDAATAEPHAWAPVPQTLIVTFMSDPDVYFGRPVDKLMDDEARLLKLAAYGTVLAIELDSGVFAMKPDEFLDSLLCLGKVDELFVGENFRFGAGGRGGISDLQDFAEENDAELHVMDLVQRHGSPISATRMRESLRQGDVDDVLFCTGGRPYGVSGCVVHGRGEGTGFGFATANVERDPNGPVMPREGVYGGIARIGDKLYGAAINVGRPMSFEDALCDLEVHILDFEGDLYGQRINVFFIEWLRPQIAFDSHEDLIATVNDNISHVQEKTEKWIEMTGSKVRTWLG